MPEAAATESKRIRLVLEGFTAAWNSGDLRAISEVYTDPHIDANRPQPLTSREELLSELKEFFEGFESTIRVTSDEVIVGGGWAFQRGEFELLLTAKDAGAPETIRRRYIEVLRRSAEGRWQVYWGIDGPIKEIAPRPGRKE